MVRLEGVLQFVGRTLLVDTEVAGQPMTAGQRVLLLLQSANHNEHEFPDAERFDIHRMPPRQVGFGHGVHFCIGVHAARTVGVAILRGLLERYPSYDIDLAGATRPPSEFQIGSTRCLWSSSDRSSSSPAHHATPGRGHAEATAPPGTPASAPPSDSAAAVGRRPTPRPGRDELHPIGMAVDHGRHHELVGSRPLHELLQLGADRVGAADEWDPVQPCTIWRSDGVNRYSAASSGVGYSRDDPCAGGGS